MRDLAHRCWYLTSGIRTNNQSDNHLTRTTNRQTSKQTNQLITQPTIDGHGCQWHQRGGQSAVAMTKTTTNTTTITTQRPRPSGKPCLAHHSRPNVAQTRYISTSTYLTIRTWYVRNSNVGNASFRCHCPGSSDHFRILKTYPKRSFFFRTEWNVYVTPVCKNKKKSRIPKVQ